MYFEWLPLLESSGQVNLHHTRSCFRSENFPRRSIFPTVRLQSPPGPLVNSTDKQAFNQRWGRKSATSAGAASGLRGIIQHHPSAHDCPAALHSNQQWEPNRLVNFPGDFLCPDDLAVESVWIRFAERQSIHSFRDVVVLVCECACVCLCVVGSVSLIQRYELRGRKRSTDNANLNQRQANLPHL